MRILSHIQELCDAVHMAYPLCAQSPQAYDGDDDEPNLAGSATQQVLAEPLGPGGLGEAMGMQPGAEELAVREGVAINSVRMAAFIWPSPHARCGASAGHWLTVPWRSSHTELTSRAWGPGTESLSDCPAASVSSTGLCCWLGGDLGWCQSVLEGCGLNWGSPLSRYL